MRFKIIALAAVAAGLAGGIIGIGAMQAIDNGDGGSAVSAPTTTEASSQSSSQNSSQVTSTTENCLAAADIYETVRPSVVEVRSAGAQSQGTGTGVVIDKDGHILTNYHVISGASTIEVLFSDGSTASAELVGEDKANDLAVIKVTSSDVNLVPAELGDSDALRPGDEVLAIGNPFSLEGTLTQGIVSAVNRTYATGSSTRPIRGMIQTDAAVNPGNSGGPLLNCRGQVVGINTLLENPTGQNVNVGIAFAVAINTAKRAMPQMLGGETVSHPWLGIAGVDVTPAIATKLNLGTNSGVYVTVVSNGSPAGKAGLQGAYASANQAAASPELAPGGDVIMSVDGHEVKSVEDLGGYLDQNKKPGDTVELKVIRGGETVTITAQLAEWPASNGA
jgi:serine protease Do